MTKKEIQLLIQGYKHNDLTWHDIQDIVEAYIMAEDGKGMTLDINVIHNRVLKENKILEEIEKAIRDEEMEDFWNDVYADEE